MHSAEWLATFGHLDERSQIYAAAIADGIDRYGFFHNVGASGGLRGRKRSLFEGGIRVPCLVRWPRRVPAGRNDDTTVLSTLDLLPTLRAAAGVAVPAAVSPDGESMLDALEGRTVERSSPLFWEWRNAKPASDWAWPELAVRDGRWKLLTTADGGRTELYDLINEPTERVERAADQPGQVKRLGSLVRTWRDSLPARIDPLVLLAGATGSPDPSGAAAIVGDEAELPQGQRPPVFDRSIISRRLETCSFS